MEDQFMMRCARVS